MESHGNQTAIISVWFPCDGNIAKGSNMIVTDFEAWYI